MKSIKKDWQFIVEGVKAVTEKTEKIVDEMDRFEKPDAASKSKAPTETPRKRAVKTGADVTASDSVLDIIHEKGKGVDVAELKERTGLNEKEIRRAIYNLRKEGKIKRVFVAND